MAGEHAAALSDELEAWLDREARERGVDRERLLERAVEAYRLLDDGGALDAESEDRRAVDAAVEDLTHRVAAVEDDLDAKIDDVRSRVVQVKREADEKAPADHAHADIEADVSAALETAEDAAAAVSALDDRVDRGFENYEEVLSYLRDERDELDEKQTRLASAVVDLRERTAALDRERGLDGGLGDLRAEAARRGVASADCERCGGTVHLGLLDAPICPHCDTGVVGVEPARGFFGSARLLAGDPPALTGDAGGPDGASDDRRSPDASASTGTPRDATGATHDD